MIAFFANIFGYVLNFLYELVGNFGLAIILFSILIKLIMFPISKKQQKTMEKSQKLNEEMKQIQFKYKNDPEKLNQEVMNLYKREKMSPFSGCLSSIIQIVLLFSVFYLVRSPLTYMRKVDKEVIGKLESIVQQDGNASNYKEIAVINYINNIRSKESVSEEDKNNYIEEEKQELKDKEENKDSENILEENSLEENKQNNNNLEKDEFNVADYIDELYVNMEFLGIDLSKVPTEDLTNWKVLIIPILYVISSFISIKLTTNSQNNKKKEEKNLIGDGSEKENKQEEYDPMAEANKSMSWFMPIMSISIACIAPLGLALYWLMNNILMILERIILKKFLNDNEEEAKKDA